MFSRRVAFSTILIGAVLVACSSHGSGGNFLPQNGQVALPAVDSDLVITANLPARTIGEELPSEGVGTYQSPFWKATIGGYTQMQYAQTLGFPPGTKITIRNLSKKIPHTLDVVSVIKGPPARFPKNPSLKMQKHGGTVLAACTTFWSSALKPNRDSKERLRRRGLRRPRPVRAPRVTKNP